MAAIKSKRVPLTNAPKPTTVGPKGGQPPAFRATGMGYFNKLPRFPADEKIANAYLINKAVGPNDTNRKIYLFVDATETGWQVSGSTTQTQGSRSFYPRNLSQDQLIIQGTVANQYEFDRLAVFVRHHQHSQFSTFAMSIDTTDQHGNYPACDFALFRPQMDQALNTHAPLHYGLVIENMEVGHERFKNFPTYELVCKVTYDYLEDKNDLDQAIGWATSVKDVFGTVKNPSMTHGKDTTTTSQSAKNQPSQPTHPGANP